MLNRKFDLEDRLVKFACMCLEVCDVLPNTKTGQNLEFQLSKSSTASALVYGEAQAAESKADFIHKMKVVLKEIRESRVNLRIIIEKPVIHSEKALIALKEANELMAIFLKSIETARQNKVGPTSLFLISYSLFIIPYSPLSTMLISHLAAASENNVIGKNNELPWNLPEDFKYFKNKTWGMPVIMGWNTFNSLKNALPGRFNIVVTSKQDWNMEGVMIAHSINEALNKATETDCKEVFIIGGGKIFEQSTGLINRIYLTRVHTTLEGDVFYPAIDESKWKIILADKHFADEKHAFDYTFETWEKK